jgi:hypothetical protein
LGSSLAATQLAASQEGLSSMEVWLCVILTNLSLVWKWKFNVKYPNVILTHILGNCSAANKWSYEQTLIACI